MYILKGRLTFKISINLRTSLQPLRNRTQVQTNKMYQTLFAYSILSLASQCFAAPVAKSNWPHNTGPEVHDAIASSPGRGHWPHNTGPKVKYAIRKRSGDISKRQAVGVDITNERVKYTMDLEVGTPAQTITLDVDTGSSDIWMFGPRSCSDCVGGVCELAQLPTFRQS